MTQDPQQLDNYIKAIYLFDLTNECRTGIEVILGQKLFLAIKSEQPQYQNNLIPDAYSNFTIMPPVASAPPMNRGDDDDNDMLVVPVASAPPLELDDAPHPPTEEPKPVSTTNWKRSPSQAELIGEFGLNATDAQFPEVPRDETPKSAEKVLC